MDVRDQVDGSVAQTPIYEQIRYEVDDPVATIILNRPEVLNAWTSRMAQEVRHAVALAEHDPAVVGIVITGAGRAFCAGADMKVLSSLMRGGQEFGEGSGAVRGELDARAGDPTFGVDFQGEYTYLMAVPKPIIAAINGPIAGMAVPIVLACDLRYMAEDAILTTAFSQRGLIAEWGSSWLLPRLVGQAVAVDLLFSSREIDGREAAELRLVNAALPAGEVLAHSQRYVRNLAERCSPTSLAVMKRQINQQLHQGLGPAEAEAQRLMVDSFGQPDFAEGVASFLEKRAPRFQRLGRIGI